MFNPYKSAGQQLVVYMLIVYLVENALYCYFIRQKLQVGTYVVTLKRGTIFKIYSLKGNCLMIKVM